ncbi:MAG: hypothetical protein ACUVQG_05805 [Thermogutta sp.]
MDRMDNLEISQEMIDRLVDGELEEPARSVILRRLEHDAVLCRQIALAFLEHQAWREVFANPSSYFEPSERPTVAVGELPAGSAQILHSANDGRAGDAETFAPSKTVSSGEYTGRQSKARSLLWISAIAASFFFAFLGSWYIQSMLFQNRSPIKNPSAPGGPLLANGSSTTPANREDTSVSPPHLEMVSVPLPIDESGTWATFEVPMISSPEGPIMEMIPAGMVPAEILESLVAEGHTVEQERRFVPVALPDGRESVVPIDQVRIQFVGDSKR